MSTDGQVAGRAPIYARLLRLRRLKITGLMSFLLLECTIAVAILLALAELVSWWAVPLLPVLVAVMVKVNDMVGGPGKQAVAVAGSRSPRVQTQRDDVSAPFFDDRAHDGSRERDERDWNASWAEPVQDERAGDASSDPRAAERAWGEPVSDSHGAERSWDEPVSDTHRAEGAWDEPAPDTYGGGRTWEESVRDDRSWEEREPAMARTAAPVVDRPTEEIMLPVELTGRPRQRQAVAMEHAATTEFHMIVDDGQAEYVTDSIPTPQHRDPAEQAVNEAYRAYESGAYGREVYETQEFPGIGQAAAGYGEYGYTASDYDQPAYGHAAREHSTNEHGSYGYAANRSEYRHAAHERDEYETHTPAAREQAIRDANSGRHAAMTPAHNAYEGAPEYAGDHGYAEGSVYTDDSAYAGSMAATVPAFPAITDPHAARSAEAEYAARSAEPAYPGYPAESTYADRSAEAAYSEAAYSEAAYSEAAYSQAAYSEAAYSDGSASYGVPSRAGRSAEPAHAVPVGQTSRAVPSALAAPTTQPGSAFPAQAVPAARSMSGGSLAAAGSALTARGRSGGDAYSDSRSQARTGQPQRSWNDKPEATPPAWNDQQEATPAWNDRAETGRGRSGQQEAAWARSGQAETAGAWNSQAEAGRGQREGASARGRNGQQEAGWARNGQAEAGSARASSAPSHATDRPARAGSHAASYWSRVAAGQGPGMAPARSEGGVPPNLPGAAAPRRAQLFGAAVRRSMAAQAQQIGSNALGGTTRGASTRRSRDSANDTGRHSRGEGGGSRQVIRFNDRGFGRLRDA